MASGVYIRTPEMRENMSKYQKLIKRGWHEGLVNTGRTRFKKGVKSWNTELIGWLSDEHKEKLRIANTGKIGWLKGKYGYLCGKNNPNWKGGRTDEEHRLRRTQQWLDWRKKVFEKDNYTCRQCGAKSGENYDGTVYLEPHHRIGVHELFINNFKDYIFNVDNGLTLCKRCHLLITADQRRTN